MTYLLRRLLHGVAVVFGVSLVVFGLTWLSGDPTSVLVPLSATTAEREQFRHALGLDRPLPIQYLDFLGRALRGDFGESLRQRSRALPLVLERLPATARLMGAALLFAVAIGVPLGGLAAAFHGGPIDYVVRWLALLGQSLAPPWLGVLLILLFAVTLRWLPSSGMARPEGIVLPAVVAGAYAAAALTRLLRASLLDVLANEYIRTARAKGLTSRAVFARHALKNAALPVVTFLGLQVAFLFGNAVVAEALFAYPGMGRLAVDAIGTRDVPVIQVFVMLAAVVIVLANLVVDLLYAWLDPRVRSV